MENEVSITKFNIDGKPIFVKCDWHNTENDLFHIQLFNDVGTWKGRYSREFARKYMENFDGTEEEYYKSVKDALTGSDSSYVYEFSRILGGDSDCQFVWKKTFQDEAEYVYGAVPVHHASDVSALTLMDHLLEENKNLKNILTVFQTKHKELANDLEKCHKCLEKYADAKNDLESNLYSKFLQLLNAKKRRIDLLENCILNGVVKQNSYNEECDEVD